ncbi:MAG TPA: hypothetical protein VGJ05_15940 [Fimbriiglobus sp.]
MPEVLFGGELNKELFDGFAVKRSERLETAPFHDPPEASHDELHVVWRVPL